MANPLEDRFDDVELLQELSGGAWYRARGPSQAELDVAVFSQDPQEIRPILERYQKVRHPHLPELRDVLELSQPSALAAVFASPRGPSLRDGAGKQDVRSAVDWGCRISEALTALHEADLSHGDIEPGWIRIVEGRGAVLTGLVLNRSRARRDGHGDGLSQTLPFAPPEQLRGEPIGPKSDIYSLAAVIFEALTGRPPIHTDDETGGDLDGLRRVILSERVPGLARVRADLRGVLGYAVDRALSSEPSRRFPNSEAFRKALRSALVVAPRLGKLPMGVSDPNSPASEEVSKRTASKTAARSAPPPPMKPARPPTPKRPMPPTPSFSGRTLRPGSKPDAPAKPPPAGPTLDTRDTLEEDELSLVDIEPLRESEVELIQAESTKVDPVYDLDGPESPPVGPTSVPPPPPPEALEGEATRRYEAKDSLSNPKAPTKNRSSEEELEAEATRQYTIQDAAEPAEGAPAEGPGAAGDEADEKSDTATKSKRRRATASWKPPAASADRDAPETPRAVVAKEGSRKPVREPTLRMIYGKDGEAQLKKVKESSVPPPTAEAFGDHGTQPLGRLSESTSAGDSPVIPAAERRRQATQPLGELGLPGEQGGAPNEVKGELTEDDLKDSVQAAPEPAAPPEAEARGADVGKAQSTPPEDEDKDTASAHTIPPPSTKEQKRVSVPTFRVPREGDGPQPWYWLAAAAAVAAVLFGAGVGVGSLFGEPETMTAARPAPQQPTTAPLATGEPPMEITVVDPEEGAQVPEVAVSEVAAEVAEVPEVAGAAEEPRLLALQGVPDGAVIRVDGEAIEGSTIPLGSGRRTVEVVAEGRLPWRAEIGEGPEGRLVVELRGLPEAAPAVEAEEEDDRPRRRWTDEERRRARERRRSRQRAGGTRGGRRPSAVRDPGF